jgi:hypothetical protein
MEREHRSDLFRGPEYPLGLLPQQKLLSKGRHGAKVTKKHGAPAIPHQRAIRHETIRKSNIWPPLGCRLQKKEPDELRSSCPGSREGRWSRNRITATLRVWNTSPMDAGSSQVSSKSKMSKFSAMRAGLSISRWQSGSAAGASAA